LPAWRSSYDLGGFEVRRVVPPIQARSVMSLGGKRLDGPCFRWWNCCRIASHTAAEYIQQR
jgi:hypothetical protein